MSSQPPPHLDTDDQAQRQLIAERVLKRVRLSKAKRALQTRLRLAGFKASHGWQDVSFEKIEPQLLGTLKQRQAESSPTPIDLSRWTTPDHRLPSYHSESESTHTFSLRTTPQMNSGTFNAPSSSQPRSQVQPPSYPHTPEQIIRSKWTMARIPSQTHSNTTPEDDELRDQTTAAEMMLFLATGSPSPDHDRSPPLPNTDVTMLSFSHNFEHNLKNLS
ncbi:hypothetical protein PSTT_04413 [Puccinia striiformis]|uniref:Uncharacterized protein n=1 Tax=Puccinia striiformis TaxID=27350 RepID=A0A2S4VTH3_9BASI|nr:hypothetical protein PSTT_04413 [Puccinia striiformis]